MGRQHLYLALFSREHCHRPDPHGPGGKGGAPDPLPHDPRSCRHPGLPNPGGLPLLAECVPRAKAEDAGKAETHRELSEAKLS